MWIDTSFYSAAATASLTSFISVVGSNLAMTLPSRSIKNSDEEYLRNLKNSDKNRLNIDPGEAVEGIKETLNGLLRNFPDELMPWSDKLPENFVTDII